jgi:hypothetical protein
MQHASFLKNLVNGCLDGFFFCYIGLQGEELVWELFGEGGELSAW